MNILSSGIKPCEGNGNQFAWLTVRQAMESFLSLVFAFGYIQLAKCIPLSQFYPFGTTQGDSSLHRTVDYYSPINLSVISFPLFDQYHDVVFVSCVNKLSLVAIMV